MRPAKFLALFLALLTAPLLAEGDFQPAVQPGGDIPQPSTPTASPSLSPVQRPTAAQLQFIRREAMIPMRDGAKLYTVLIVPKGAGRFPIMLDRTPYSADLATGEGRQGSLPENLLSPLNAELFRAGYILAIQDVRGKYKSEGEYVMNRPLRGRLNLTAVDHSTDAWDTIDWLVRNLPESNGRVGSFGTSYDGFTALMSLVNPHPALRASVPINPMVDVWKGDDWFHNGAFRQEMIGYVYGQTANRRSEAEWFKTSSDDYATFLRYGSAGAYGRAMGVDRLPFWRRLTQHPDYDEYWQDQAVDRILAARPLAVPTLIIGSQWDQEDIYGATALFGALKSSANAHFALGPWFHGQVNSTAVSLGPLFWGTDTARSFRQQVLIPFLNEHLKGGLPAGTPRVIAFEAGSNHWQRLDDWPLACARGCLVNLTPVFPAHKGRADFVRPEKLASDWYISDPARPVPYRKRPDLQPYGPNSSWPVWLVDDQRFAGSRPDVLSYSTTPLALPIHLAGTPLVHLVASTTGTDSDWVVKLIDVYPDNTGRRDLAGYELPIAMNVMRGRYRADAAHPTPLQPNAALTYEFALPQVDYVVQPGHRLMVQVQSSWFPLYDRNPQTFVPNIFFAKRSDYRSATQRVFTGPGGTWIGLPIVH